MHGARLGQFIRTQTRIVPYLKVADKNYWTTGPLKFYSENLYTARRARLWENMSSCALNKGDAAAGDGLKYHSFLRLQYTCKRNAHIPKYWLETPPQIVGFIYWTRNLFYFTTMEYLDTVSRKKWPERWQSKSPVIQTLDGGDAKRLRPSN